MFKAPSGQRNVFWIACVTPALLNFRAAFSSDLHFQKFPFHYGQLLLQKVFHTHKVQGAPLVCLLLYTVFFWLCGRRARRKEGLRAGGMPPAIFNELWGPSSGDKREKAEGRVLGWWLGWECILLLCLGERKVGGPVMALAGEGFQGQILASRQAVLVVETAGSGLL